jgi:predicted Fe-S protein YdhL (DUF1289 family)
MLEAELASHLLELLTTAPGDDGIEVTRNRLAHDQSPCVSICAVDEKLVQHGRSNDIIVSVERAMDLLSRARVRVGERVRATGSQRAYVGEASFNGCIAICQRPRSEIARWLPAGTRLSDSADGECAEQVAVFLFGEQTQGTVHFAGVPLTLGIRYFEFALLVPGVSLGADRAAHTFVARMYSSYFPAVWSGNAHFGFAKELAQMGWSGSEFWVQPQGGRAILHAAIERGAEWSPASESAAAGVSMLRLLSQLPVLGLRRDGRMVRSRFEFGLSTASARAAEATLFVANSLAPGQHPGEYRAAPGSALEIRDVAWRLGWPEPIASQSDDWGGE